MGIEMEVRIRSMRGTLKQRKAVLIFQVGTQRALGFMPTGVRTETRWGE